jgi:multicomponent Na+:H+ antiporter subunit C
MLYITMGKVDGGTAPILMENAGGSAADVVYSNPVPHVLMLTAIVVGISTTALGLALCVRIYEEFGTLEDDEVREAELASDADGDRA